MCRVAPRLVAEHAALQDTALSWCAEVHSRAVDEARDLLAVPGAEATDLAGSYVRSDQNNRGAVVVHCVLENDAVDVAMPPSNVLLCFFALVVADERPNDLHNTLSDVQVGKGVHVSGERAGSSDGCSRLNGSGSTEPWFATTSHVNGRRRNGR